MVWAKLSCWAEVKFFHWPATFPRISKPLSISPLPFTVEIGSGSFASSLADDSEYIFLNINLSDVPTWLPDCLVAEPIAATIPFNSSNVTPAVLAAAAEFLIADPISFAVMANLDSTELQESKNLKDWFPSSRKICIAEVKSSIASLAESVEALDAKVAVFVLSKTSSWFRPCWPKTVIVFKTSVTGTPYCLPMLAADLPNLSKSVVIGFIVILKLAKLTSICEISSKDFPK